MQSVSFQGLMVKETATSISITNPDSIYDLLKESSNLAQETVTLITLNTRNKIIKTHLVHIGSLNQSILSVKSVFRLALLDNASAIIVSHNHPSGDPTPSTEDIKITKLLIEAGKTLETKLIDHVIIGDGQDGNKKFISLRETGLCQF